MDPKKLRAEILRLAAEHEATGSAYFLGDKKIADDLGVDKADVQRQMLILGDTQHLLKLTKTMGPNYAARITPDGLYAYEQQQDTERQNAERREEPVMTQPGSPIKLFISHSSADADLAERVAELVRSALTLPASAIRCTSVDAYRLPGGADTDTVLKREVHDSVSFIGIVSNRSVQSMYVLFELGARWGANRPLLPLLAPGSPMTLLGGPLGGLNAHRADNRAHLHQLVTDLGRELQITPGDGSTYQQQIDRILQLALPEAPAPPRDRPRQDAEFLGSVVGGKDGWMAS